MFATAARGPGLLLVMLALGGCVTDTRAQRHEQIAAAERILPRVGDAPAAAEMRFQLAMLHFEEAEDLERTPGSESLAAPHWRAAFAELDYVFTRFPEYERMPEVLHWRAEALSRSHSWNEAVAAWTLARQHQTGLRDHEPWSRIRLAEALRFMRRCEEALPLLEGLRYEDARLERCRCEVALERRAGPCELAADAGT